jgi:hypothetical protein
VDGKGEGSWVEVAVKWSERGKDVHLCNLCVYFTYFFTVSDHLSTGPTLGSLGCWNFVWFYSHTDLSLSPSPSPLRFSQNPT